MTGRGNRSPEVWFHRKPYGFIDRVCIEIAYWRQRFERVWIGWRSR